MNACPRRRDCVACVLSLFTAAAALEKGTVTPGTRIKDVGTLRLDKGRTKIDNANRQGMGWLTFEDAIAWSRNVVAAKVALGLGTTTKKAATTLHEMWTRLGFGQPTGIDVAGDRLRDRGGRRRGRRGRPGHGTSLSHAFRDGLRERAASSRIPRHEDVAIRRLRIARRHGGVGARDRDQHIRGRSRVEQRIHDRLLQA